MEQHEVDENRIDNMLRAAYRHGFVPESVNIRLQNQLKCKEAMQEKSISVWWLPAFLVQLWRLPDLQLLSYCILLLI